MSEGGGATLRLGRRAPIALVLALLVELALGRVELALGRLLAGLELGQALLEPVAAVVAGVQPLGQPLDLGVLGVELGLEGLGLGGKGGVGGGRAGTGRGAGRGPITDANVAAVLRPRSRPRRTKEKGTYG